jgi:20S proteasome alpha/beta subunit
MDQYVMSFDLGVSLLVAGVDDSGAHLYSIGNPGASVNDHQPIGYHSVGSGWLHAMQSMIGFGHMSARGLKETIFTVYASKRRAEVAPGVGRDTDMTIVQADGIKQLDRTMLDNLEKIFQEYQKPVSQEVKDEINKFVLD